MRKTRLGQLRTRLEALKLDGFLVTNLPNIRYLCGYTGSNGLLVITRERSYFCTDFRYQEQARTEVKGAQVMIRARDLITDFPVELTRGLRRLGFEKSFLSFGAYQAIRRQVKGPRLVPCENLVAELRAAKEAGEIERIAQATRITDRAFQQVLALVRPGVSERDLANEIEYRLKQSGGVAFETIVASGPHGALPHAQPTTRKLRTGDAVVFDLGATFGGYCSDMTRTVFVGAADRKGREVYEIVLDAQLRALGGVRAGALSKAVDALARDYITEHGYGEQFGHGLGHGVGLEVHEQPALNSRSSQALPENAVVTVEPGIYLAGWGGVRIEDTVVVTRQGCRILTASTKRLLEV